MENIKKLKMLRMFALILGIGLLFIPFCGIIQTESGDVTYYSTFNLLMEFKDILLMTLVVIAIFGLGVSLVISILDFKKNCSKVVTYVFNGLILLILGPLIYYYYQGTQYSEIVFDGYTLIAILLIVYYIALVGFNFILYAFDTYSSKEEK